LYYFKNVVTVDVYIWVGGDVSYQYL